MANYESDSSCDSRASSCSSDLDVLMASVVFNRSAPYQFEPQLSKEEIQKKKFLKTNTEDHQKSMQSEQIVQHENRLESTDWCQCQNCKLMPYAYECLCCHEVNHTKTILNDYEVKGCISSLNDFKAHMNPSVLRTFLKNNRKNWKKISKGVGPDGTLSNKQYRLVAYRHILEWVLKDEVFGSNKRMTLPSCVVSVVRETFPSDDGSYAGFKISTVEDI